MEHPASLPSPQPWRAAALVAAAIAAVELFILVVIGVAFGAKFLTDEAKKGTLPFATTQAAHSSTQTATPTDANPGTAPAAGPGQPKLTRRETSVMVLNGNGVSGAAAAGADRVRARDYMIAGSGNAPRTGFRRSLVMFRPGFEPEARRLARDLRLKRVVPLDGMRAADLQGAHVAYIIGG